MAVEVRVDRNTLETASLPMRNLRERINGKPPFLCPLVSRTEMAIYDLWFKLDTEKLGAETRLSMQSRGKIPPSPMEMRKNVKGIIQAERLANKGRFKLYGTRVRLILTPTPKLADDFPSPPRALHSSP